ncbi:MAG: FxsA family protein [Ancalomicrobiaceae bacterium]|nr:FxsA family protein [Ancalomicrobiaceae bacterium]
MPYIPLLILAWPFIEIAGFVVVGQQIGVLGTVALTLATSALGAALLRHQGTALLADMQRSLRTEGLRGSHLGHGALISLAAFLLLLPGFVGDCIGLLLFLPPVRSLVIAVLARNFHVVVVGERRSGTVDLDPDEWRRTEGPGSSKPGDAKHLAPPSDDTSGNS